MGATLTALVLFVRFASVERPAANSTAVGRWQYTLFWWILQQNLTLAKSCNGLFPPVVCRKSYCCAAERYLHSSSCRVAAAAAAVPYCTTVSETESSPSRSARTWWCFFFALCTCHLLTPSPPYGSASRRRSAVGFGRPKCHEPLAMLHAVGGRYHTPSRRPPIVKA